MAAVFASLVPIFALILLGFWLRKGGIVPEADWHGVAQLAYWLFFPALLVDTLADADLLALPLTGLLPALVLSVLVVCSAALVLIPMMRRAMALDGPAISTVFQASVRWQGFIALALVDELYGDIGVALIAVALAAMVPLVNVASVAAVAALVAGRAPSASHLLGLLARNPIVLGVLLGLALSLAPFRLPDPALDFFDIAGSAGLATGLVVCGAGLRVRDALPPSPAVLLSCALKLVLYPLVMAGLCTLFDVEGTARSVAIIAAAVPTAMNGYVVARAMGGDASLYAASATVQTVLAFATIPVMLAWLG